jgi:hypothetical protein
MAGGTGPTRTVLYDGGVQKATKKRDEMTSNESARVDSGISNMPRVTGKGFFRNCVFVALSSLWRSRFLIGWIENKWQ